MIRRYLTLTLTVLVFNLAFGATAFGSTSNEEKAARDAEKVRANVVKLGTGKEAQIEVKLKDGGKLKGYVSQINENGFVVVDENTAAPTETPFLTVSKVKGRNVRTGVSIALWTAFIVVVTIAVVAAIQVAKD